MTDQMPLNPYLAHLENERSCNSGQRGRRRPAFAPREALGGASRPMLVPDATLRHQNPSNVTEKIKQSNAKNIFPAPKRRPLHSLGNYAHYYSKRVGPLARVDPRLSWFEKSWFAGKKVLDVGCNAGFLTIALGMFFSPAFVEGVDIDPGLVRKARMNLAQRASLVQPVSGDHGLSVETRAEGQMQIDQVAQSSSLDPMDIDQVNLPMSMDLEYFPKSCLLQLGSLPIIAAPPESWSLQPFPLNVRFRCGDWLHEPNPSNTDLKYDVILALSVTKWIHLNHGDDGIKLFFQRCFHSLNSGGLLLLEPQPFDSYRKRGLILSDEMRNNYRNITLKPEDFEKYLVERVNFRRVDHVVASTMNGTKGFCRPLLLCIK
ncbi:uncharacterized protein SPPG_05105 [Spizellomyces punctatus DAOM BR117]|uniref:RNA methyltransferase n=1 Tax=Spizellomyces punctatus (strain DAOM BR117) TaxID=645134 RepID=A0A0L0HG06_SPIPD|nr:uncharacterized protein SPPG_05105 [Spizellomyces punctatus DAOM BR117]KNC99723.1 hypothetical protein SPPG_05105 [Spizellomyces punctatus DAOM BR117]|eukprot:XP_016607763.1 hypothetical protein SPPG_05105 [Spizellomyces punctatus DAOM BR117]